MASMLQSRGPLSIEPGQSMSLLTEHDLPDRKSCEEQRLRNLSASLRSIAARSKVDGEDTDWRDSLQAIQDELPRSVGFASMPTWFDVDGVVGGAVGLVRACAAARGVRIDAWALPCRMKGDARGLALMMNALMRALLETSSAGDTLTVTASYEMGAHVWAVHTTASTGLQTSECDGSLTDLAVAQRLARDHGGVLRVDRDDEGLTLTAFFDATELSAAALTMAYDKGARENQYLSRVIASLVHDVKGGLTNVKALARIARTNVTERELGRAARRLETIETSADLVDALCGDILEANRVLQHGGPIKDLVPVDLATLVGQSIDEHSALMEAAGCPVLVYAEGPVLVLGHPRILRRVLANLLSNAARHGKMSAVEIHVSRRSDSTVTMEVRDHGKGMAAGDVERWKSRASSSVEPADQRFVHFGMGLWIVRSLVGALGGGVTVESEEGRGTTFSVSLTAA